MSSSIRDIKRYLEAHIEYALKVPLRKAKNVTLGVPIVPSVVGITTTKNTALPVSYNNRKYMVTYDRRDIQTWMSPNFMPDQFMHLPLDLVNTSEFLPFFNKRWGLGLRAVDIIDEPLIVTNTAGKFTVALRMSPANPWFTGTLQIPIWPRQTADSVTAYAVNWEPRMSVSAITVGTQREMSEGAIYTWGLDYSAIAATIAAVVPNPTRTWQNGDQTQLTNLATAMTTVDGFPWKYSTSVVAWNLGYANVLYNGPTEAYSHKIYTEATAGRYGPDNGYLRYDQYVNKAMKNVLVIQLNQNYGAQNIGGMLFIHYGGPTDAIAEVPYVAPQQYWPLNGDVKNKVVGNGDFLPPVTWWDQTDGTKRPSLTTTGVFQMGATLNGSNDYTLSITLAAPYRATPAWIGLMGDSTGTANNGSLRISDKMLPVNTGATTRWTAAQAEAEMHSLNNYVLTVVKKGNVLRYYANGQLVMIADYPAGYNPVNLSHFGKANEVLPTNFMFYDIYYYDYAMSASQVEKLARGDYGRS